MSSISFQDYFAALGTRTTEPKHLKPFAAFCAAPNDSVDTIANLLTATPDLPALLAGPEKQVFVVHHFKYDMRHALNESASGKLFTLLGRNSTPMPAVVDPATVLAIPSGASRGLRVPLYETLTTAKDAAAFKATTPSTRANSDQLTCRSLLAIPPFLASVLMRADSTDPSVLGVLAIRALRDFDSRASQNMAEEERKDEDAPGWEQLEDPNSDMQWRRTDELACTSMADAVRFLWAVCNGHIPSATLLPATSSQAEDWAADVTRRCLARAVTPSPTGTHRTAGTSPSDDTMVNLATSIAALTDQFAKQEDRLLDAKTEKEEKGFAHLPSFTRELILFVSGDVETTDQTGSVTTTPRTRPIQSCQELLKLANVALAKQHLDYHLQTVHNCPTSVPMATALAITMGRFTWPNETVPDAFSIFAFAPLELGGATNPTDEFVHLQLKSEEGKGLSDADVSRSMKVQHRLPQTEHVNTKQHSDAEAERPQKRKATSFCEADLKARDCIPSTKNPGLTKKSKDEGGNVDLNNLDTNQLVLWALFWRATSNSLQVENRGLQQKQAVREESITQTWELDMEMQQLNQTVESSSRFMAEGAATIQEINKFESDSLATHLTMDKIRPILCEFGFLSDAVSAVLQYELLDNPFLFSHISTSVQVHVCTLGNTWNHVRIPLC